jgi:UDP-glucose 4-epimerase
MEDVTNKGSYFKISSRENYRNLEKLFKKRKFNQEYTSHNTNRLNVKEIKKILLKEKYIQNRLYG